MNMQLAELYMPLAESMARKRSHRLPANVTLDDVRSAALYGLSEAAHRYDPERGVPFHSYARWRISGEIGDLFRGLRYNASEAEDAPAKESGDALETEDFFDFVSSEVGEADGKMLKMYYVDGRSLKEVGLSRGVSESRASQIFKECHRRLKKRLERKVHP